MDFKFSHSKCILFPFLKVNILKANNDFNSKNFFIRNNYTTVRHYFIILVEGSNDFNNVFKFWNKFQIIF